MMMMMMRLVRGEESVSQLVRLQEHTARMFEK